jgi:hypothetical protein
MKTLLIYAVSLWAACLFVQAQDPIKWGKIPSEDLKMTVYTEDPSATAAILYDYGRVTVAPRVEYFRHVRVKILNSKGSGFATIEIPFRSVDNFEDITQLDGQTFNINEKGEVIKTKLKATDIQEVKIDERNRKKVFTLPDVKPGAVIEYRYTIRSMDLVRPGDWYFQSTIPTLNSEFEINIPRDFDYLITYTKGVWLTNIEQKDYAAKIQWLYNNTINQVRRELSKQHDLLWESANQGTRVFLMQKQTTRFKMKNVPAFKPEKGMEVFSDYYPSVKMHLYMAAGNYRFYYRPILIAAKKDYDSFSRSALRYEDNFIGQIAYWLPTWDEANKTWLTNEKIGMRLMKAFDYKPILTEAFKQSTSELDSINGLCQWVKQHIVWSGSLTASANNNFDQILKKGTGSSGEINLLLVSLLQHAGFNAAPVLIRTRNLGRPENIYPAKDQFNHLVCNIKTSAGDIFLDAATTQNVGGQLPWYVNHATGWVVKKEGYGWIELGDPNIVPKPTGKLQEI